MPSIAYDVALSGVIRAVAEIFEVEESTLNASTRLMIDLPCESIDLLEIAARLARNFRLQIDDDALFLRSLRVRIEEAGAGTAEVIRKAYPHITEDRAQALATAIADPSPQITLGDMAAYVCHLAAQK